MTDETKPDESVESEDLRWSGPFGHLYDCMAKCPITNCRFYARDLAVVQRHTATCTGSDRSVYWCEECRFNCETGEEESAHYQSGDCVNEVGKLLFGGGCKCPD